MSPLARFNDVLRIGIAMWTTIFAPLFVSFYPVYEFSKLMLIGDLFADIIFAVLFIARFWTSIGDLSKGKEIVTFDRIRSALFSDWHFWCDGISLLPLVTGAVFLGVFDYQFGIDPTGFVQFMYTLRVLRFHWLFETPTSYFEAKFSSPVQIVLMVVWILIVTHLMACIWFAVVFPATINDHLALIRDPGLVTYYLLAFKFGVYMITGKPVDSFSDAELLVLCIASPLGGIFFAFIYGNTTMLISRMNATLTKHHEHLSAIKSAMISLDLPTSLRFRMIRYHHFLALHHNVTAYNALLQGLSINLFLELKAHLFSKLFQHAPFFRDASERFINAILLVLEEITFSPGDIVVRQGEIGAEMYFIVKGKCDVLDKFMNLLVTLRENEFFGEVALLSATPRLCTIRAASYCLLALITRERFLPILDDFPEQKALIVEHISKYSLKKKKGDDGYSDSGEYTSSEEESSEEVKSDEDEESVEAIEDGSVVEKPPERPKSPQPTIEPQHPLQHPRGQEDAVNMRQLMEKNMHSVGHAPRGTGIKFSGAGAASAYKNPAASKPVDPTSPKRRRVSQENNRQSTWKRSDTASEEIIKQNSKESRTSIDSKSKSNEIATDSSKVQEAPTEESPTEAEQHAALSTGIKAEILLTDMTETSSFGAKFHIVANTDPSHSSPSHLSSPRAGAVAIAPVVLERRRSAESLPAHATEESVQDRMLSLRAVGQSTRQIVDILKMAVEEKVELMHAEMLGGIMIHLDNLQVEEQFRCQKL